MASSRVDPVDGFGIGLGPEGSASCVSPKLLSWLIQKGLWLGECAEITIDIRDVECLQVPHDNGSNCNGKDDVVMSDRVFARVAGEGVAWEVDSVGSLFT